MGPILLLMWATGSSALWSADNGRSAVGSFSLAVPTGYTPFSPQETEALQASFGRMTNEVYLNYSGHESPAGAVQVHAWRSESGISLIAVDFTVPPHTDLMSELKKEASEKSNWAVGHGAIRGKPRFSNLRKTGFEGFEVEFDTPDGKRVFSSGMMDLKRSTKEILDLQLIESISEPEAGTDRLLSDIIDSVSYSARVPGPERSGEHGQASSVDQATKEKRGSDEIPYLPIIGATAALLALESFVLWIFWRFTVGRSSDEIADSPKPEQEWEVEDTVASLEMPFRRERPEWAKWFVKPIGFLYGSLAVAVLAHFLLLSTVKNEDRRFSEGIHAAASRQHQGDPMAPLSGAAQAGGSFIGMMVPALLMMFGTIIGCAGSLLVGVMILVGPPAPAGDPKKVVKLFYKSVLLGGLDEEPGGIWYLASGARARFVDRFWYLIHWKRARLQVIEASSLPKGRDAKVESLSFGNIEITSNSQGETGFGVTIRLKTSVVVGGTGSSTQWSYSKTVHEVTGKLLRVGSKWYIEDCTWKGLQGGLNPGAAKLPLRPAL